MLPHHLKIPPIAARVGKEGRACIVEEFKERLRSFEEEASPIVLFAKLKCKSLCVVSMCGFGWNVNEDDKAIFNGLQQ